MKLSFSFYTNVGKVRQNNEDALLVINKVYSEENFEDCKSEFVQGEEFIFVVADGMGGHSKGEVASRLTLESLLENKKRVFENPEEVLQLSKRKLDEYAMNNPSALGLGCAVAGIVLKGGIAKVFNAGDCRVYRFINSKLIRLTKDHSVVERLLSLGVINESEAKHHPQRHVLISCIIGDPDSEINEIFINEVEIYEDDVFLICSDGLWDELNEEEIKTALSEKEPCKAFLSLLSEKPLKDNLSFIIVKVEEVEDGGSS